MEIRNHKKTYEEVERESVNKMDYGLLDDDGVVNVYVEAIRFARADFQSAVYDYVDARERLERAEKTLNASADYHSIKKMICEKTHKVDRERLKYFMHRAHKKTGRAGKVNSIDYEEYLKDFRDYGIKTMERISAVSRLICDAESAWAEKEEAITTICDCGAFLRELRDGIMGGDI